MLPSFIIGAIFPGARADVLDEPLLVVILGPTGSGKTSLSLALAEKFNGEIVNCDSVASYREFEIGTAKPSPAERARVPHHLLDIIEPSGYITAGEYAQQARLVLNDIKSRGALPIVVGGTGLYLRALMEGLFAGPQRSDELRAKFRTREEIRPGYLHRLLRRLDATAAAGIHANDLPKLIRAIEVCITSKRKMSDLWQEGRDPLKGFSALRLGLNPPRSRLYEHINHRAQRMFENGLIEETRGLLEKYGESASPLNSLGYKQAVQFIRGQLDFKSALSAAQQAHRNYAKRQMTWFRHEPNVTWLEGFGDEPVVQKQAVETVHKQRTQPTP